MDRLDAMAVLLKVVDRGSFSAASRELGLPIATVSRNVSELEARLGTQLLLRTTRRIALTDAGILYVPAARRILEEINETERQAAGEYNAPRGELFITGPMLFGRLHVLPIVTEFLMTYPAINVRLALSDRNLHLLDDHVDVAVRIGSLPDSGQIATRIGTMRTVVCASPGFLMAHQTPKVPRDLSALPAVGFGFLATAANWSFRSLETATAQEIPISPRLTVSTAEAAVWAAVQGMGVTRVLHYQCAEAVAQGDLRIVLNDYEPAPLPVHVIHAEGRMLPQKTRTFLDFAIPRLRQRLGGL
jgi:DNA-binding transcriptional LysR family regulator